MLLNLAVDYSRCWNKPLLFIRIIEKSGHSNDYKVNELWSGFLSFNTLGFDWNPFNEFIYEIVITFENW
jgi:hypothetical protein